MADAASPAPKRRLPFKRTVARKKSPEPDSANPIAKEADDGDDGIQFFRRNHDAFSYFEDLEEGAKSKKNKNSSSTGSNTIKAAPDREEEGRDSKRRKVSLDSNGENDSGFVGSGSSRIRRLSSSASATKEPSPPVNRENVKDDESDDLIMDVKGKGREIISPRRPRSQRNSLATTTPSKNLITIDDDDDDGGAGGDNDDDGDYKPSPSARHGFLPPMDHRRASASPDLEIIGSSEPDKAEDNDLDDEFALEIAQARARQMARAAATLGGDSAQVNKAPIAIMVDSPAVPGATPAFFKRRIGQSLDRVLEMWIQLQRTRGAEVPADMVGKLFLTWKRNKIYPSASAATLPGIEIDPQGNLRSNTRHDKEGGFYEGGLYLEVWTEDLLIEHEKNVERERQLSLGILDDEDDLEALAEPVPEAPKAKGIKMVLKAKKDFKPFRITVHPDTAVDTMIAAFRKERDVGEAREISIYFDGEELDPAMLVEELDVDHDETNQLEVHIK